MGMKSAWVMEAPFFTPPPVKGRYLKGLWGGGDSPAPPDPYATADAQGRANVDAARTSTRLNRYDQFTPFGTSKWKEVGAQTYFDETGYNKAIDEWRRNMAAAPATQSPGYFDPNVGMWLPGGPSQAQLANSMPTRDAFTSTSNTDKWVNEFTLDPKIQNMLDMFLNTSQAPVPEFEFDGTAKRQEVEDALYQRQKSRLDPRFAEEENMLRSRLANQGITEGSEAYDKEIGLFGRNKNDAYENATLGSITGAGNDMAQQFNMDLTAHNSKLNDRAAMLNMLTALATGAQVQAPGAGTQQVGAAPVAQSIYNSYQGQVASANAETASDNQMLGTAGTLAVTALMFF